MSSTSVGAKKRTLRIGAGKLVRTFVLDDGLVLRIHCLATSMNEGEMADVMILLYEYFLSIQSDGRLLNVGCDSFAIE